MTNPLWHWLRDLPELKLANALAASAGARLWLCGGTLRGALAFAALLIGGVGTGGQSQKACGAQHQWFSNQSHLSSSCHLQDIQRRYSKYVPAHQRLLAEMCLVRPC